MENNICPKGNRVCKFYDEYRVASSFFVHKRCNFEKKKVADVEECPLANKFKQPGDVLEFE